jgi:hypothetical protein
VDSAHAQALCCLAVVAHAVQNPTHTSLVRGVECG